MGERGVGAARVRCTVSRNSKHFSSSSTFSKDALIPCNSALKASWGNSRSMELPFRPSRGSAALAGAGRTVVAATAGQMAVRAVVRDADPLLV